MCLYVFQFILQRYEKKSRQNVKSCVFDVSGVVDGCLWIVLLAKWTFVAHYGIFRETDKPRLVCLSEYVCISFILCFGQDNKGHLQESALHASALRQLPY